MFSYFEIRKTIKFYVLCLNSRETKIKTLFLILYFNLSKRRNGTLDTRIKEILSSFLKTFKKKKKMWHSDRT